MRAMIKKSVVENGYETVPFVQLAVGRTRLRNNMLEGFNM